LHGGGYLLIKLIFVFSFFNYCIQSNIFILLELLLVILTAKSSGYKLILSVFDK
jgi:hypothetical protein